MADPVDPADASGPIGAKDGAARYSLSQDHPAFLKAYPEGIDWGAPIVPTPVCDLLDRVTKSHPDNIAADFMGRKTSYGELARAVDHAASCLQALGVTKGKRIGLFLPNCVPFMVYYFAAMRIGAVVVNYNPLYTNDELSHQIEDSGTELMITLDLSMLFDKIDALLETGTLERGVVISFPALLPSSKAVLYKLFRGRELADPKRAKAADRWIAEADLRPHPDGVTVPDIDPFADIAVLQYTGGTTGTPKGAMLTHANLTTNVQQLNLWAPHLEMGTERVLGALPFFHVFAMTVVMNWAVSRANEIIIMPRFVLQDALRLIHRTKPTIMPGVPTIFNAINNHPKVGTFDLSSLKFCISGGAALPLEVRQEFEKLAGCNLIEGYGLSETAPVACCNPLSGPPKDKSIGLPLPRTLISLRDLDNPAIEVPHGEKGEICISGPQVMKGYWNNDDATQRAFVGSYFRTGDVAVQDDDGFFFIIDRVKDLIICSGYNVYPRRIEDAISTHEAVEEVTVIGVPDDYRGEAPMAFVKLKAGQTLSEAELAAHLEERLSRIEMPASISFRDELPKTMIGKLSKKELRAEIEDASTPA
ncbi:MAG: long-chain fatty acid--CoA ligase [Pseudomonadota bacterium]